MSGGPPLPGLLQNLAPVLNHYGYLAVALFVTAEDFGVPLPGETILIAAAVYAGAGKLNIVLVGVVAFLAAVLGDNIGYVIGHFGGRRLVLKYGRYLLLTERRLDRAEEFFARQGAKIVTVARFIEGLRQANGIVAGLAGMSWRRFLVFNALGGALWVAAWTTLGYVAGGHIDVIYTQISRYSLYVGIAIGVVVIALIVRALWHRHRQQAQHQQQDRDPASSEGEGPGQSAETGSRQDGAGVPEP